MLARRWERRSAGLVANLVEVATVEALNRPVHRYLEIDHTADAEDELGASALVSGPVEDQPDVPFEFVGMPLDEVGEIGRTILLFAVEDESKIGRRLDLGIFQRVECGENRNDRALVVR